MMLWEEIKKIDDALNQALQAAGNHKALLHYQDVIIKKLTLRIEHLESKKHACETEWKMNWISVRERLPMEYGQYLVYGGDGCQCAQQNHENRLDFLQNRYDVATWSKADMTVYNWYKDKPDRSWDWIGIPHWSESCLTSKQIKYWMPLPNKPKEIVIRITNE